MKQTIDSIYFFFPVISLILSLINIKFKKKKNLLLLILLILFLGFSTSGADYLSYMSIYNNIENGLNLQSIHGEIGYKILNKIGAEIGLDYIEFKIIYFVSLYILLYKNLQKISTNLPYSLFLAYTGYLLYFLTINRQFLSMIFCIWSFNIYKNKKLKKAIFINIIAIFIHISSFFPLIFLIFIKKIKRIKLNKLKLISLILIAFISRIFIGKYFFKLKFLFDIIGKGDQFKYYSNETTIQIFTLGLLNRIFFLFVLIIFLKTIIKDEFMKNIFIFYFLGGIIYILIPNFIVERLIINSKIFEIILIPYLIYFNKAISINQFYKRLILFIVITIMSFVLLYNQLSKQLGYYPYKNIIYLKIIK